MQPSFNHVEPDCLGYQHHAWDEERERREEEFNVQTEAGVVNTVRKWYHCGKCGSSKYKEESTLTSYPKLSSPRGH